MSEDERANWQRIKDTMEEESTTDNYFYQRACAICNDEPDQLKPLE